MALGMTRAERSGCDREPCLTRACVHGENPVGVSLPFLKSWEKESEPGPHRHATISNVSSLCMFSSLSGSLTVSSS